MSEVDVDCTSHDLHVSLAIETFTRTYGGQIICADGRLPFRGHKAPTPPVLRGYQPDAVIQINNAIWIIEVKSFGDLNSTHSKNQFSILQKLLAVNTDLNLFILIFDAMGRNVQIPLEFFDYQDTGRVMITYL